MPHKAGNGAILGIVSEDGIPDQKRVFLMDRSNMRMVAQTVSDADGAYVFSGLNPDTNDYLAFAVDDNDPKKQPIIYDYIQPIPAHQGGYYWANWYRRAMLDEPAAIFLGKTWKGGVLAGMSRFPFESRGTILPGGQTLTPGAALHAATEFQNGCVFGYCHNLKNIMKGMDPCIASAEWVLDLANTTTPEVALYWSRWWDSDYWAASTSYTAGFITILVQKTAGKIYIGYNNNAEANYIQNGFTYNQVYTLTDEDKNRTLHLMASVTYADHIDFFLDGKLKSTISLTGKSTRPYLNSSYQSRMVVLCGSRYYSGGNYNTEHYANMTTGPFAVYAKHFTEAEATERYNLLMTNNLPLVTGYLKAVIEDIPLFFFRLNDLGNDAYLRCALIPDGERKANKILATNMQASTETIVNGGASIYFNGSTGGRANWLYGASPNRNAFTIEWCMKPNLLTFSTWQSILRLTNTDETVYLGVEWQSTGFIRISQRISSASVFIDFPANVFTNAINEMHHYAVVVDKVDGFATLYINGEQASQLSVAKAVLDNLVTITSDYNETHIGCVGADSLASVSNGFQGYLAEIAFFADALTAEQIKAHYDAKDII